MKFPAFFQSCALVLLLPGIICSSSEVFWSLDGEQGALLPSVVLSTETRQACALQCNMSPLNCTNFYWVSANKNCYLTVKENELQTARPRGEGRIYKEETLPSQCENGGIFDPIQGSCNCTGTDFQGENCTELIICKNGGQLDPVLNVCNCSNTGYNGTNCTELVCPAILPGNVVEMDWQPREINKLTGVITRCDQDFMPSSDLPEVFCVNDVWTGATCNRRIFHYPPKTVVHLLPRPMEIGWAACIHGYPTDNLRFSFLLREDDSLSAVTAAYFDYRNYHVGPPPTYNTTVFDTLHSGAFIGTFEMEENINPYPFLAGRNLTMHFSVLGETDVTNTGTCDGLSIVKQYTYARNLLDVIGVFYNHDVNVTYMDLWCHVPLT